ncbi:MAG: hypothetical protein GWP18_05545 [Proteobacteria bacterium]|nr:hypothetical protein [Pseudomonadota bacterium]
MKKLAVLVVMAMVVAACSGASEPDVADAPTTTAAVSSSGSSSPIESTVTTTVAAPTTVAGASDLSSCVVGEWEMQSQRFFDDLYAAAPAQDLPPGEFTHTGGSYVLIVGGDGSFASERRAWTFEVTSDFGDLIMKVSSSQSGTYTLDGELLSTSLAEGEAPDVEMVVDGVPFEFPEGLAPVSAPSANFSGAMVTCDGDVLTASFDGFTSIWDRS